MEGLIVEWHAPGPQIELATEGRSVLHIPGYAQVSLPGAPRLPYTSVLVALPPGSLPTIEILNSTETTVRLPAPLALADQPEGVQVASDGSITGGAFIPAQEERTFSPQEITLESVGILRGVHLARLSFYPALPSGDSLQLVSHIEAKVNFNAVIQPSSAAVVNADPLLATVKSAVINPDHLQIGESFNGETNPGLVSQNSEIPIVAIEVSEKGLTEVTFSDLQAANFPLDSINPDDLQLTRDGNAIAYQLLGDEDSIFEATESLRFFADPQFSLQLVSLLAFPGLNRCSKTIRSTLPIATVPRYQRAGMAIAGSGTVYNCLSLSPGRTIFNYLALINPDQPI
jgi:hypothetical protein